MKVKLHTITHCAHDTSVTVGKVYEATCIDESGDAHITDDDGNSSFLFQGEYEVIEE